MARYYVWKLFKEFQKSKKEFRSFDPNYQAHVIKVRMIALAWFGFICTGGGVFVCSTPYMDRKRLERGEVIEYRSPTDTSSMFHSIFSRSSQKQLELESPEEYAKSMGK